MIDISLVKVRAKGSVNGDKWVVGTQLEVQNDGHAFVDNVLVDPNSICRFTGLKDANGTDIYENDRLKPAHYFAPIMLSAEKEEMTKSAGFSNPVVRWNPYLSAFQLISEYIFQTPPKMIDNGRHIQSDYEVDHVRKVRFQALTPDLAQQFVVYGNTIDNPDDSDYRMLPPKAADDFTAFYIDKKIDDDDDDDDDLF